MDQLDQDIEDGTANGGVGLSELEMADKMYFEYLSHAYGLWLDNQEDEVINKHLMDKFGRERERVVTCLR